MIYSQSFNFNSYVEKGVPAEVRNSPPLKLFLHYNPLNSDDVGLGQGWSFGNLSSYDQGSKTLVLSTGENYKVTETTSSVFMTDQKLKNFKFQKKSTTSYCVILKSGQVEMLSNFNNRSTVNVPTDIYGANGRSLKLSWVFSGTQPRLSKVEGESQDLIEVIYSTDTSTTITRAPGTAEAATFTLVKRNNQLVELGLPLDGSPAWKFTYGTGGLTNVTSPTGATEDISYKAAGFLLPSGAPVNSIPYVISHTVRPFHDQPAIRTTYSYSDHNFLGYGGGRNWTNDGDNLYLTPADYEYTSTSQVEGGTTTTHTYNKFHLLLSKQQQKGSKQLTQATTYYALSNTAFDSQPAQYQLPKAQTTIYRDTSTGTSRTETTQSTYDDWGNQTSEVPPSGITTTRDYYDPAGEVVSGQVLCPPDPHGFQRYLKRETVIPATSTYSTPTRAHSYTYLQLPTTTDALTDYCVAIRQRQLTEDGRTLSSSDYTYVNQPQSSDHGRVQQQVTRVLDQSSTTYKWTYNHDISLELRKTTTMMSDDGQTTQEETTSSLVSGLTLATKDRAGTETMQQYDSMARLLQTTTAPGTAFEATIKYAYAVLENAAGWRVTVTDTKGVQTRYFTDRLNRVVRVESQDDDGQWDQYNTYTGTFRVVRERHYNALDQCIEEAEIDWLRASGTATTELRTTRSLEYDDWGQVYKVIKNSGSVQLSVTDPIALTQTVGLEGEGQTRVQYNTFMTPTSETLVRRNGTVESMVEYAYDGLGRRKQMTDGLGRSTHYTYDSFDRVVQTTWPDSHAITTQYAAQSTAALPVAINLQGTAGFSEQSFDGLERLLRTTVGGRTTSKTYQGVDPVPAQVIDPRGERSQRTYEPALDYALTGRVTSDGTDAYQYDKQTGDVVQLDSPLAAANLSYYPSSLLSRETIQTVDGARTVQYVYSQAGKLQEYTDINGQQHVTQYDAYGRRREISVGTLKTTLSYGQADRVVMSMVQDGNTSVTLTTNIEYDDFGREVQRTIWNGTKKLSQCTQAYDATGLVTARKRSDGNGTVTRQETFQYDSLSRLVDYECQGTQPPVDEKGRTLRRQRFTLNGYDGFTQIQTSFVDGSENTQTHTYSAQDPTQLVRIMNTHPDEAAVIDLEYDANGCLTKDEHGWTLVYNASHRLAAVYDEQNQLLCEYAHDATDRLVRQKIPDELDTQLSYRGDTLVAITKGERQTSFVSDGGMYSGEVQKQGDKINIQLWGSDAQHSVSTWLDTQDPEQIHDQPYTPYGFSSTSESAAIGFNGVWRDPVTGWYHLGSGNRVYSPSLKSFLQPDPWSPFTSGEINPYAYCLANPINRADPSGHWSWRSFAQWTAGLAVGVLTAGIGLPVTLAASVAIGLVVNVAVGAIYDLATETTPTVRSVGLDALTGAVGGFVGGSVGMNVPASWAANRGSAVATEIALTLILDSLVPDPFSSLSSLSDTSISTASWSLGGSTTSASATTVPGRIPDWPLEKLRQRGSATKKQSQTQQQQQFWTESGDDTYSSIARSTSRETITAEDISLNVFGGSFDRSQFALQLSPDHRVSFSMDTKAAQVPIWDVQGFSRYMIVVEANLIRLDAPHKCSISYISYTSTQRNRKQRVAVIVNPKRPGRLPPSTDQTVLGPTNGFKSLLALLLFSFIDSQGNAGPCRGTVRMTGGLDGRWLVGIESKKWRVLVFNPGFMPATLRADITSFNSTTKVKAQGGILEGSNPAQYDSSNPIVIFIIQAGIIIIFCRLLHWPLSKIRQPRVIAEVIAGVRLGPSVMGRIPGFTDAVFPTASIPNLNLVVNLGLVLFLFSVSAAGMILPFGLGCAIAYGLYNTFQDEPGTVDISFATFLLFIGIAMAITAFPVLCRILTELKLLGTNVGVIVLSAGVGNDVVGWILLALCVALVNAGTGLTALWVLLVCVGTQPVRGRHHAAIAVAIAFFTQIIGIHAIFGGFIIGLLCPHEGGFAIKLTEKIEDLVAALFLPLYFTLSGLQTDLGLLDTGTVWGYVVGIIAIAFTAKVASGALASRLCGLLWRESFSIGVLMSYKGLCCSYK
ncbi:K(+)/H(+) antiporter 1 [Aspergillus awamori]|uniref:K(+)/H(+) antiporter 1 n=1 Tax=Aspergillus awamori TaxID=105351 RepID=A0A401L2W5_ASPAW|nr:K(+)/H(+) antiporter 1 [Aspergillus awamori]